MPAVYQNQKSKDLQPETEKEERTKACLLPKGRTQAESVHSPTLGGCLHNTELRATLHTGYVSGGLETFDFNINFGLYFLITVNSYLIRQMHEVKDLHSLEKPWSVIKCCFPLHKEAFFSPPLSSLYKWKTLLK